MPKEFTIGAVLIAEYENLKKEQSARISARDRLPCATLASLAGTIAATVEGRGRSALQLVLPAVCAVMGWTYVVNDENISALGRYLREQLTPRIALLVGEAGVLEWEQTHRTDWHRRSRERLQMAIELMTLVLPACCAVIAYWLVGPYNALYLVLCVVEVVVAGVFAAHFIQNADLSGSAR